MKFMVPTENEIFLKVEVKPRESAGTGKFYVHDSLTFVRKDHQKKRILTSRDLGSKIHSSVSASAYSFE